MNDWRIRGKTIEAPEALQWLREIRTSVTALGCSINPSARIALFEQQLKRFLEPHYRPLDDAAFDCEEHIQAQIHGNRDLFDLYFICKHLAQDHGNSLRTDLPHLLKGRTVPAIDENPRPRNLQFQYLLTAQLASAGLHVMLEEPDMVFVHEEECIGIAAKRVTSPQRVIPLIKEGVEQLARANLRGLVALSLDRLSCPDPSRPKISYFPAGSHEALADAVLPALQEVFKPHAETAQRVLARPTIVGLILSLTLVGYVRWPWKPAFENQTVFIPPEDNRPQEVGVLQDIVRVLTAPLAQRLEQRRRP